MPLSVPDSFFKWTNNTFNSQTTNTSLRLSLLALTCHTITNIRDRFGI